MDNKNTYIKELAKNHGLYSSYENVDEKMTWCAECGNYGIQKALFRALTLENIEQDQCIIAYDVGCSGNESDKLGAYTIHWLHGRVLPLAEGIVLANPKLKVIAHAGDGATFSEGVNHLVHAVRNDYPILFIHHHNGTYGLTTGQASATTHTGQKMNASPDGVIVDPINTLQFVLSLNPTFVARSFSGDMEHMTEMIRAGLAHQGFAFLEIAQACPTYNRAQTHEWYMSHIQDVATIPSYDPTDIWQARKVVDNLTESIPTGILYTRESKSFIERLMHREGIETTLVDEVKSREIQDLI